VEGLTHQVKHLAMILDEVREDLGWAVRNDKFYAVGHSQNYVNTLIAESDDAEADESEDATLPERTIEPRPPGNGSLFD